MLTRCDGLIATYAHPAIQPPGEGVSRFHAGGSLRDRHTLPDKTDRLKAKGCVPHSGRRHDAVLPLRRGLTTPRGLRLDDGRVVFVQHDAAVLETGHGDGFFDCIMRADDEEIHVG